ncbi:hypothetical protein [Ruminococcus flavefaciens]|uniref:Uncharacterized protein n=1 Tax=Ruminococcus flavefaciens TaxID=1265 RepID=A0A1K1NSE1_RUMFL|nr:hypothetical protein [Ruminococcus flavefaciens]SFW38201.1 hypothetical protein SAMN02910280_2223 [Ruminococcus flavefaciens]
MKVNFKRMITALAAAAMCAVPMTSAMSASAEYAERSYSLAKADKQAEEAYIAELLKQVNSEDVTIVRGSVSYTLKDPIKVREEREAKRRFEVWKMIHGGDPINPEYALADSSAVLAGTEIVGGKYTPDYTGPLKSDIVLAGKGTIYTKK